MWGRYDVRRPTLAEIIEHIRLGGYVGITPQSIGCSTLDVDEGDPRDLIEHHPPLAVTASRLPGRCHIWYRDPEDRGNGGPFRAWGCAGDWRSGGTGYVILWEQAAPTLVAALATPPPHQADFPIHLIDTREPAHPELQPEDKRDSSPPEMLPPESLYPGCRNRGTFRLVSAWAYPQPRGGEDGHGKAVWQQSLTQYALEIAARIPDRSDFPDSEVRTIARSIADWTWSHPDFGRAGGPVDHDTQSRRGVQSGRSRRAATAERDTRIKQLAAEGHPQRHIAQTEGVTQSTVSRILCRRAPTPPDRFVHKTSSGAPRPPGALGTSVLRTYYARVGEHLGGRPQRHAERALARYLAGLRRHVGPEVAERRRVWALEMAGQLDLAIQGGMAIPVAFAHVRGGRYDLLLPGAPEPG